MLIQWLLFTGMVNFQLKNQPFLHAQILRIIQSGHKQLEIVEVSQDIKELVDLLMTTNYQEDAKGVELVQEINGNR